jgi:hypothetical protein
MCELCEVPEEDKKWSEDGFFGIICRLCHLPMVVCEDHTAELETVDQEKAKELAEKYFPGRWPRGLGMRSCQNHYHEHYV